MQFKLASNHSKVWGQYKYSTGVGQWH